MNFIKFQEAIIAQFEQMKNLDLYTVEINKDTIWETYQNAFPEGSNPIYRERRVHDCQCCKQFIARAGNVVAYSGGKRITIWDVELNLDPAFNAVAIAMADLVRNAAIREPFYHYESFVGTKQNHGQDFVGKVETWDHFYLDLPADVVVPKTDIPTTISKLRSSKDVFKRSLEEITIDSINTVLELIDQKSLYRGDDHKIILELFKACLVAYHQTDKTTEQKDMYTWDATKVVPGSALRIRNTSIGTLLVELSEGKDLDSSVGRFEAMVAPANYKRPKALVTKGMIKKAKEKVEELGLSESLERRHATPEDITINNVLFADRSARAALGDVFDQLNSQVAVDPQKFSKVEEVSIETFIEDILPKAESIEIMLENKHTGNLMSLIAPLHPEAPNMLMWGNNFSWTYNGEIADSMREDVVSRGGSVTGVLRFTHAWNHEGKNQSLMDLHVFMPNNTSHPNGGDIAKKYGNGRRVGWNHRNDPASGGIQDIDHVRAPGKTIPLENITFPSIHRMPEGIYKLKVHNWRSRNPNTQGFKAEIEVGGEIHQYEYAKAVKHHEWIDIADVTLKDGNFTIEHKLESSSAAKQIWGITTMQFQKCTMVMNSPNHWDGEKTGNKQLFFIIEGCVQPGSVRGFYNEFLMDSLRENRKVFEHLGSMIRVTESDDQLSGLGFSLTQRNSVLCRVKGSFNRVIQINF